ncbi:MAG: acyl-CoA desaturase [Chromatiales bacterium 21-64-14]|nr:MAG: acyl-CoA desaturase [Chromatiales bacterium 21-64-14]
MLSGLLHLPVWGLVLATLALTHVTIAAVTIFLHRHQAHRALDLHPIVSHFFRFWLWLTTAMVTKQWVATHRKHHARCETDEDPHSPQVAGIRTVLWRGAELYQAQARNSETLSQYGHGTPDDWLERHLYGRAPSAGPVLMLVTDLALFGLAGIAIWGIQMLWIPFWAAGVINGIGHWWGYRNFKTEDASTNITPVALLIGGEELHNNHHAFPSSAKFSSKWWEIDLGWWYIRLLALVRLARVRKVAPRPHLVEGKGRVDMETLRAVAVNRYHVMAEFASRVLVPTLRDELQRADRSCRSLYRRARHGVLRDDAFLDEHARTSLKEVLSRSQQLRVIYEFKRRLQEVWARSTPNQDRLLRSLQEWCHQAEATGILVLQEFAARLARYRLQPA